jgi:hypothetical protein
MTDSQFLSESRAILARVDGMKDTFKAIVALDKHNEKWDAKIFEVLRAAKANPLIQSDIFEITSTLVTIWRFLIERMTFPEFQRYSEHIQKE